MLASSTYIKLDNNKNRKYLFFSKMLVSKIPKSDKFGNMSLKIENINSNKTGVVNPIDKRSLCVLV